MKLVDKLKKLGIKDYGEYLAGPCFIHSASNNPKAFILYKNTGIWNCQTHGCHNQIGRSSRALARYLKVEDPKQREETEFSFDFDKIVPPKGIIGMDEIRQKLEIPSPYFIGRGFSPQILTEYCVGVSYTKGKWFYGRSVVPIFNENRMAIGFSARAHQGQNKWLHGPKGFKKSLTLYNIHRAKKHIEETETAILVEGPGDIWRLEEANIHNGVAIMGSSLSKYQEQILGRIGVSSLILLLDNDEAGHQATEQIKKQFSKLYNIVVPAFSYSDIGDTPVEKFDELQKHMYV